MEARERRNYELHIREAHNGFIVNIGCSGPIVFTSRANLIGELNAFFEGMDTDLAKKVKKEGGTLNALCIQPTQPTQSLCISH